MLAESRRLSRSILENVPQSSLVGVPRLPTAMRGTRYHYYIDHHQPSAAPGAGADRRDGQNHDTVSQRSRIQPSHRYTAAVRKRVHIALAVVAVAIVSVAVWQVLCEREPVYQGRRLSDWLEQYYDALENPESPMTGGATVVGVTADGLGGEESSKQAEAALRAIGTNAIPLLLRMAKAHDSAFKRGWIVLSYRQSLIPQSLVPLRPRSDFVYRGMSALGFYTLGSAAKPAVPTLMRLLDNENRDVRADAARTLGYMRSVAQDAVPRLVECLRGEDSETRMAAAGALKRIEPEAAAKAGVK